ncbi:peptidase [Salmonella enterica subsp. arizonae]|nr:peptidase [Salmonella enterica subsp. arizonae]
MSQMTFHILNAQNKLTAHCEWLKTSLTDTYEKARRLMSLPSLDLVVKAGTFVIPEKGHLGFCPEAGVIYITVDPDNPAFCKNDAYSIERMFAHELHHAARWAGPGYGSTLGEVIVSEVLAGHFSLELFGGEPELWESLKSDIIEPYSTKLLENWHCTDYDHNSWFFGTGGLPRWLGYTAGFNLISRYLAASPYLKASMLANIDAEELKAYL